MCKIGCDSIFKLFLAISGFEPGSFSTGFVGYKYKIEDKNLYIGVKYNVMLGCWFGDTGDFDLEIPLKGQEIENIYLKGDTTEKLIWNKEVGRVKL